MLYSWTYHPSTLSCSLCLRLEKKKIHFWFCWCFPPTGPMHLISALSLWAGTLGTNHGGVLQLPDSTKWRTWIYEHKHTEQDTTNAALRTAGQTKNMGDTVLRGADVKVHTWIKWRTWKWTRWEVLSRRLKTLDPCRKVKSVFIHIYLFCIPFPFLFHHLH